MDENQSVVGDIDLNRKWNDMTCLPMSSSPI